MAYGRAETVKGNPMKRHEAQALVGAFPCPCCGMNSGPYGEDDGLVLPGSSLKTNYTSGKLYRAICNYCDQVTLVPMRKRSAREVAQRIIEASR